MRQCRSPAGSPVATSPIAPALPALVSRIGIDRSPIDLSHPDDARWLLACVWPDTGRLERTAASIQLAQADPPPVMAGDANDLLPGVLGRLPAGETAVIVTTWAFAYFSLEDRARFVQILEAESQCRTIAWLSAEGLGTVAAFTDHPGAAGGRRRSRRRRARGGHLRRGDATLGSAGTGPGARGVDRLAGPGLTVDQLVA